MIRNESGPARIETDDQRTYFLIEIPCRSGFDPQNDPQKMSKQDERRSLIIELLRENSFISKVKIAEVIGVSSPTIKRDINKLVELGLIKYVGPSRGGHWEVIDK